jgi:F-type H+-transporting ATPase subunit a
MMLTLSLGAQHEGHDHDDNQVPASESSDSHGESSGHHYGKGECAPLDAHHEFEVGEVAMHHIADANVYSIGPWQFPLPTILYAPEKGWDVFMSSKFKQGLVGHGNGKVAYNGYVLHGSSVKRIRDNNFPEGEVTIEGYGYDMEMVNDKEKKYDFVCVNGTKYPLDTKSTADAGLFGGGITSYYDFSLTKNVVALIFIFIFMSWIFLSIAKSYKTRAGKAPRGMQNFFEPLITFIRDDVAKPFLGNKWEKYFPFLLSIFFFILFLNLFGQIPFFGNANVTGNLAVTMVLALITFLVVNISGNAHYWKHLLLAPGVPIFVKPILIPVEIMGLFIKPLTLMLRLFANITAGHIVMVVFVGLIFIFGKSGESIGGAAGAAVGSTLLTMFMMAIELIVAFVQAFVFTILTASYIGAATEEVHH